MNYSFWPAVRGRALEIEGMQRLSDGAALALNVFSQLSVSATSCLSFTEPCYPIDILVECGIICHI